MTTGEKPPTALTPAALAAQPAAAAERLLALPDDEALRDALRPLDPAEASSLVTAAPTLEEKTRLLWALGRGVRAQALERLSAPLIAALIQNLEERNQPLLADLSFEQFQRLLNLCSPARRYAWIRLAFEQGDPRAHALPLYLNNEQLLEALMSRLEFRDHIRAAGEFPIENMRLGPDDLLDPAQAIVDLFGTDLLREIPVAEPGLAAVIQSILEYDPDRYADILRRALSLLQYQSEHDEEEDDFAEAPVLLDWETVARLAAGTQPAPGPETTPPPAFDPAHPDLPVVAETILPAAMPRTLTRLVAGLPAEQRQAAAAELNALAIREAVAAGGSFALADLEPVVRRVEGTLLLGLEGEGARPGGVDLTSRPLAKLMLAGARRVEPLRQVALRLRPLREILDDGQRALVESLCRPQVTLDDAGRPALALHAAGGIEAPERISLAEAQRRLEAVAAWAALARALTLRRSAAALAAAPDGRAVVASLALGAVLYGRVEFGLVDAPDVARFAARYVTPHGRVRVSARRSLRRALDPWATEAGLSLPATEALLNTGLDRLAEAAHAGDLRAASARQWVYLP